MGTNFYIRDICSHCNRYDEEHIGKSSAGWKFIFQASKHENPEEWFTHLEANKDNIYDEYGRKEDLEKFKAFIASKKDGHDERSYHIAYPDRPYIPYNEKTEYTIDGYRFSKREFS